VNKLRRESKQDDRPVLPAMCLPRSEWVCEIRRRYDLPETVIERDLARHFSFLSREELTLAIPMADVGLGVDIIARELGRPYEVIERFVIQWRRWLDRPPDHPLFGGGGQAPVQIPPPFLVPVPVRNPLRVGIRPGPHVYPAPDDEDFGRLPPVVVTREMRRAYRFLTQREMALH
jgi:hypothetical protein